MRSQSPGVVRRFARTILVVSSNVVGLSNLFTSQHIFSTVTESTFPAAGFLVPRSTGGLTFNADSWKDEKLFLFRGFVARLMVPKDLSPLF